MSAPLPASSVLQIGSHTEWLICSDINVARSLSTCAIADCQFSVVRSTYRVIRN